MPWIFHVARDSFLAGFASRFLERATQRRRGEGGCGKEEGKGNVIYKLLDPREEGALKEERVGSVTDKSPCCPRGEFSSDRVDVERMNAVGSPWNGRFPLSIHFFCLRILSLLFASRIYTEYGIRCPSSVSQEIDGFPSLERIERIPSFFPFFHPRY